MISNTLLTSLAAKQAELDQTILSNFNLTMNQDLHYKKLLAFFVELGEFANEERSFKYWSKKKVENHAKILEEYIDGVHFILSLGLDIKYDFADHEPFVEEGDLYVTLLNVIKHGGEFFTHHSFWEYRKMLSSFLRIADLLRYTEQDIVAAYDAKHQENLQRQDNNY